MPQRPPLAAYVVFVSDMLC